MEFTRGVPSKFCMNSKLSRPFQDLQSCTVNCGLKQSTRRLCYSLSGFCAQVADTTKPERGASSNQNALSDLFSGFFGHTAVRLHGRMATRLCGRTPVRLCGRAFVRPCGRVRPYGRAASYGNRYPRQRYSHAPRLQAILNDLGIQASLGKSEQV